MMWMGSTFRRSALAVAVLQVPMFSAAKTATAQAPVAAPAAAGKQLGTVKAISGNTLTLAADGGAQTAVTVADGARIVQLAPGSTDLKAAQPITLGDIAVGDRVLVTGKSGDDGSFTAARVILMKSSDIAQKNETEKTDWQRRGAGGIVTAVSGTTITISSGSRKIAVQTGGTTKFRRYAADSVKFEDTLAGTLAQIQAGDQLRVRGDKADDGLTITAEEVVSGSFKNLAGTLTSVNTANNTVTLKDLASKKTVTVAVTPNSDLRNLPAEIGTRLAARQSGANRAGAAAPAAGAASGAGARASGAAGSGRPEGEGAPATGGPAGSGRAGGGDLSQMLSRLPTSTFSALKTGEAVMIVASDSGSSLTAVTMLTGVEPILAASPNGSPQMTLSPWSMGGGGSAAEAGSPQ